MITIARRILVTAGLYSINIILFYLSDILTKAEKERREDKSVFLSVEYSEVSLHFFVIFPHHTSK